jgi:epidermal growth factor receptor substrate 15
VYFNRILKPKTFHLQVNKLRDQCQKQEETIKEQESELDSRKAELHKMREEEKSLEKEYDSGLKEKENISTQLQDTQLQISQVRAMFSQVEEIQRQMRDALTVCKAAVEESNASMISDYSLNIEPDFREFREVLLSPEEKKKDGKFDREFDDLHGFSQYISLHYSIQRLKIRIQ